MPDYGMGQTNIDKATGIRYGVISHHEVTQAWYDSAEAYYGDPHCPKCGDEEIEKGCIDSFPDYQEWTDQGSDFYCKQCKLSFNGEDAYGDEPLSHFLDDGEYKAECGESGDIFIMKSPYYTYGPFCSPCAPGAVSLVRSSDYDDGERKGPRAYCFAADFFEDDKAPYRYYSVATSEEVKP